MRAIAAVAGVLAILLVLLDAFQTVILPRRAIGRFRLTRLVYMATWAPWCWLGRFVRKPRSRETWLSIYGPSSLVFLIVMWALGLVLGFGLCFYAEGSPVTDPLVAHADFRSDIYISGTTLFTLGLGDVLPHNRFTRELLVVEAGLGLGFVAVVIGYFPVLYGAFSRREVSISLLDARAGSPPSAAELLRRHAFTGGSTALVTLLEEWERWAAELLESHISYPLLCYFRSQHTNQSWLSALCAVLDTCALMVATVQDMPGRQAQLTFAMARHAVVDLSQVFELEPVQPEHDRLSPGAFEQLHDLLCQAGTRVARDPGSKARLAEMRALYEPYVECLCRYLSMDVPPFVPQRPRRDNWQTVAQVLHATQVASASGPTSPQPEHEEEHHIF
ncbi:potassium channel family protein [Acidipila sp. EB88]|uniref:potassium channel family protein n=1 Tax=Acidipila sp. EB88 TaxID=2305226 RepID=UPI000F5F7150|nr:potassium channel family protein [Acidipila sp. EB88]RRA48738.1 two pore domain potassium channel family protein [Acidipila sp. EB88]